MVYFNIDKVRAAIQEKGYWEHYEEWRIFTITHFRITATEQLDERNQKTRLVYAVQVLCDYDLRCVSPTLERALHFCGTFQDWIERGFEKEGWPSWADKKKVDP